MTALLVNDAKPGTGDKIDNISMNIVKTSITDVQQNIGRKGDVNAKSDMVRSNAFNPATLHNSYSLPSLSTASTQCPTTGCLIDFQQNPPSSINIERDTSADAQSSKKRPLRVYSGQQHQQHFGYTTGDKTMKMGDPGCKYQQEIFSQQQNNFDVHCENIQGYGSAGMESIYNPAMLQLDYGSIDVSGVKNSTMFQQQSDDWSNSLGQHPPSNDT
eukprot:797780-Ditylum_brightwellii.AAC.1